MPFGSVGALETQLCSLLCVCFLGVAMNLRSNIILLGIAAPLLLKTL